MAFLSCRGWGLRLLRAFLVILIYFPFDSYKYDGVCSSCWYNRVMFLSTFKVINSCDNTIVSGNNCHIFSRKSPAACRKLFFKQKPKNCRNAETRVTDHFSSSPWGNGSLRNGTDLTLYYFRVQPLSDMLSCVTPTLNSHASSPVTIWQWNAALRME